MEQILGIIVFGALIALCVFGLRQSRSAMRDGTGSAMAFVPGKGKGAGSTGASPERRTEDRVTTSETSEPKGLKKDETTSPDRAKRETGPERPQADRPLTSGDVGA
jgi:hypothetical protein